MEREQRQMNRRQFLRTAGKAAFGAGFAAAAFAPTVAATDAGQDGLAQYDFVMPRVRYMHEKK